VSREVCLLEFMLCVCVCVCVCVCLRFYLYDENGNALLCFPCAIINMAWYREKERKKERDGLGVINYRSRIVEIMNRSEQVSSSL